MHEGAKYVGLRVLFVQQHNYVYTFVANLEDDFYKIILRLECFVVYFFKEKDNINAKA